MSSAVAGTGQYAAKALHSSLSKLEISHQHQQDKRNYKNRAPPADSWEDEAASSSSDSEEAPTTPTGKVDDSPAAPPPTPSSPGFRRQNLTPSRSLVSEDAFEDRFGTSSARARRTAERDEDKRPEKSTSAASRLIAAGIGQKPPKRTPEQRQYDQAVKVQEKKRRDAAKEDEAREKAAKEKAKRDVWGD